MSIYLTSEGGVLAEEEMVEQYLPPAGALVDCDRTTPWKTNSFRYHQSVIQKYFRKILEGPK